MLKIISLGGSGQVTRNMFLYEQDNNILLIDCGIGFPTEEMLGVDLLIPDISYLQGKMDNIRGMLLTHGHEDHIGALPYILPKLGANFPIYASKLTAALAQDKLEEQNIQRQITVIDTDAEFQIGPFAIKCARVSHSIPDTYHYIIKSSDGTVYHGADFKFDFTPVDGIQPQMGKIAAAGNEGVTLLISDCLGSERKGATPSERTLDDMFERELSNCEGKFIVTTMSSSISRLQQAIKAAVHHGRKVVLAGRSLEKNVSIAVKLGYLQVDPKHIIPVKKAKRYKDKELAFLVAGSQGQTGSAMYRIAAGEHSHIEIKPGDKVVFSADYIPGSESSIHWVIDELYEKGASVVYADIKDDLHVSGHGSRHDLMMMINLTQPRYIYPIGGTYRHMIQYSLLAQKMGYKSEQVLLVTDRSVVINQGKVYLGERENIQNVMVDGLGVGDVGKVVLRDRQVLAEEGVVVVLLQIDTNTKKLVSEPDIITRGFVYMQPDNDLIPQAKKIIKKTLQTDKENKRYADWHRIKQVTSERLEQLFAQRLNRYPMIIPVVIEV